VDSKEELDKAPPEVRERYNKLEVQDLPGVVPNSFVDREDQDDNDDDVEVNSDNNDSDDDNDKDDGDARVDASHATMENVSFEACPSTVRNWNIISI
jgi:ABC-type Zn2+ transport system substrate-binding protein/surface adhesin